MTVESALPLMFCFKGFFFIIITIFEPFAPVLQKVLLSSVPDVIKLFFKPQENAVYEL